MSVVESFELVFEPQEAANVLHANATYFFDPSNPTEEGELTLNATNDSTTPVNVVVQVVGGNTIFETDYFPTGVTRTKGALAVPYVKQTVKIVRWAPDIVGIPGDGGGDILFTMPQQGSVHIDLTVVSG